ncbi:rIIB protector from prophage-induced early lysis [Aeromonas phage 65]|uniref:Lysis inhibitor n=2 Tax=Ishigurovirus osborne TaxID=260149 RepID=A0A219YCR2_9CAUD|nr:RIIB lysis inhibitor [Aeromonas phage 65]ADQ53445.1 rIIB protector from prophage-induced early lysis [Aeromonas phage 65]APU01801.1 lysis inhibitor [Aeromonas phage 65.2]
MKTNYEAVFDLIYDGIYDVTGIKVTSRDMSKTLGWIGLDGLDVVELIMYIEESLDTDFQHINDFDDYDAISNLNIREFANLIVKYKYYVHPLERYVDEHQVVESREDKVIRLHKTGLSQNEISRQSGVPRSTVGDIVRRYKGIQKPKKVDVKNVDVVEEKKSEVSWNAGFNFINCYIDGEVITADRKHPAFDEAFKILIETNDVIRAASMLSIKKAIETYVKGDIKIIGNTLTYKDVVLDTNMTRRVVEMWKSGENIDSMINFLIRLVKNPRREAVYELFDFLKHNDIKITEDGYFLAYKRIRDDYTDIWTGTFDNSIGASPRMEPFEVDADRKNECSCGLHVASAGYIPYYSRRENDRVIMVKVDPANVVAIPEGYDHAKLRTWTYDVIKEVTYEFKNGAFKNESIGFTY